MVLRTIWNVVFLAFLLFMFAAWLEMFYVYDKALFQTFLLPATALMLIYHIYTSAMYYVYCFKHRNDEIYFKNKDKSTAKSVISTILIGGAVICFIMYTMSVVMVLPNLDTRDPKLANIVNNEIFEYSFADDEDIIIKKEFTDTKQYSFLSMYAVKGKIEIKNVVTEEEISIVRFEYAENLPWYVDMSIEKEMIEDVSTEISIHADGVNYDSIHLEKEIDGLKVAYCYLESPERSLIDVYITDGNKLFLVSENWEVCAEKNVEARVDEWIEFYKTF